MSATFKDLPGGQILGPTFDYTHRLIDPALATATQDAPQKASVAPTPAPAEPMPHVTSLLNRDGLIDANPQSGPNAPVADLTREPVSYPAGRDVRLQALSRGDEGFLLSLA